MNADVKYVAATLLAGLLLASTGRSVAPPKPVDPGFAEAVRDVLFFHTSRPILLRLHVWVDGKPYPTRWNAYLTRWFRFLDRDADGFLDAHEAARAPAIEMLKYLLTSPYTTYHFLGAPAFTDLDRDEDKQVSPDEFLRFYRQSAAGPVQIISEFPQMVQGVRQDALSDVLFDALDTNRDGKLSRVEMNKADKILDRFDEDDDEIVTVREALTGNAFSVPPGSTPPLAQAMQASALPLLSVPREEAARRLDVRLPIARQVLAHYDKNKNKALSRDEIGMKKEQFEALDANRDGELDTFELLRWVISRPDAEIVVRLGRIEKQQAAIAAVGEPNPALRIVTSSSLTFALTDARLSLIAADRVKQPPADAVRKVLIEQFKNIDSNEKGFVTKKQLSMPQFSYLHSILIVADRDEDDRLSLEELNAWVDLTMQGANCQISIALAASGRGLFPIFDANQDGKLTQREMRSAWMRMMMHDRNKDGMIGRDEIPSQYQIVVNPGVPNYLAGQLSGFTNPPGVVPKNPPPARGPLWFRKMDRNGDGELSPREFLGTQSAFRELDADGDGYVSLDEARRADAALRKK